jgi:serine/threonine protein kinase
MSAPPQLGRYQVLGRIARGGSADVFLACPVDQPQQRVVLKRLYPHLAADEEFVRMFLDEVRLLALLRHPGIVDVLDLDEDDESCFAVLGLVDGPNLKAVQRLLGQRGEVVPLAAATAIAARVADALHVAHELRCPDTGEPLQLVHRDINPHNVIVGRPAVVKLGDFGVARSTAGRQTGFLSTRATRAGLRKGRASALSPEQVRGGAIDRRADLWGLGVLVFSTVTSALPFGAGDDAAVFDAILETPTPRMVDVHPPLWDDPRLPALQALVDELLQKEASARPATAAVVASALRSLVPDDEGDRAIAALVASLQLPSLRA